MERKNHNKKRIIHLRIVLHPLHPDSTADSGGGGHPCRAACGGCADHPGVHPLHPRDEAHYIKKHGQGFRIKADKKIQHVERRLMHASDCQKSPGRCRRARKPSDSYRIRRLCRRGGSFSPPARKFLANPPSGSIATRRKQKKNAVRRRRSSYSKKWPQPLF